MAHSNETHMTCIDQGSHMTCSTSANQGLQVHTHTRLPHWYELRKPFIRICGKTVLIVRTQSTHTSLCTPIHIYKLGGKILNTESQNCTVSAVPKLLWKEQLTSLAYSEECMYRAELLAG